jgi:hypothetical protein
MNDLERQLKDALRRCDPPANFTNRVLARVVAEREMKEAGPRVVGWRWPRVRWAAAFAAIALSAAGITGYRIHERRVEAAEALAAKKQVMIALRITGSKLRIAKQKIRAVEDGQEKTGKTL